MSGNRQLIIYHAGCPDGFTAAWTCVQKFGSADLFPGYYGAEPPDVVGRNVHIVDFSYPRETLIELHKRARSLRVFDHHKTAQADLEGLPFCLFDMERSGAGLTWDVLMGDPRPWLIDYVEDRDLWRFTLPDSRAVSNYVMATPYTLEAWDQLAKTSLDDVIAGGQAVQRKIDAYCSAMSANVRHVTWEGYDFPMVNAPQVMISDLLHHLCERHADVFPSDRAMAMGWWQRADGKYQYSLRSVGDIDVSAIAKKYGGGGHANAAGFESKLAADQMLGTRTDK